MNKSIQRYLFAILFSAIGYGAYNAVNVLFFLEKGLSFQAISTLFILINLFVLLCEIPTGVLADRIKPINAVIFGSLILVCSCLLLLSELSYSFELAMGIYGVGISFISGA